MMTGSMAPALARDGPIVPCHVVLAGFLECTALEAAGKAAQLFVPVAAVCYRSVSTTTGFVQK